MDYDNKIKHMKMYMDEDVYGINFIKRRTAMKDIKLKKLTNKEAAAILKDRLNQTTLHFARCNIKSMETYMIFCAVIQAIDVLEKTPDMR